MKRQINFLNNFYNSKEEKMNELIDLNKKNDELIRDIYSKLHFNLSKDENLMSVIFNSVDQKIHCSIICKNTENFSKVEKELYNKYPEYKNKNTYFLANGNTVNKGKTLEFNKIKDNDIITLNIVINESVNNVNQM